VTARQPSTSVGREREARRAERPPTREVIVHGPGEGLLLPGPEGITLKATGEQTGGSIGLFEATSAVGFGPPRHIHYDSDELFYVLAGQFLILIGERTITAPPGSFVFIPRGTVHAPKVVGTEAGKLIGAFTPGGQERAFEEFARLMPADGGAPDPDAAQAIARKYNSEFVGPPL
jgi:mannose-6-phosphate isomerase-like protein (cupin superfamily)